MKKWVIFSLLKIFEVSLIFLSLFFSYKIGRYHIPEYNCVFQIIDGAAVIAGAFFATVFALAFIYFSIKIIIPFMLRKNMELSESISSKIGSVK